MREEILRRLANIVEEENVRIFYACESGSRAWGFPSADSDYDVRFLYQRSEDWYLSVDLEDKRDVIERPINDELDISGWDLRKALKLLAKSNPPLLEWLTSPTIYIEVGDTAKLLRQAVEEFYSPAGTFHHYMNMARNNHREFLGSDLVRVKKYFYVLRPLFAIRWIQNDPRPVPMEFEVLMRACLNDRSVISAIEDLLVRKRSGKELDREPKIPAISDFIESELQSLMAGPPPAPVERPDIEKLNQIFRETLRN